MNMQNLLMIVYLVILETFKNACFSMLDNYCRMHEYLRWVLLMASIQL